MLLLKFVFARLLFPAASVCHLIIWIGKELLLASDLVDESHGGYCIYSR